MPFSFSAYKKTSRFSLESSACLLILTDVLAETRLELASVDYQSTVLPIATTQRMRIGLTAHCTHAPALIIVPCKHKKFKNLRKFFSYYLLTN